MVLIAYVDYLQAVCPVVSKLMFETWECGFTIVSHVRAFVAVVIFNNYVFIVRLYIYSYVCHGVSYYAVAIK